MKKETKYFLNVERLSPDCLTELIEVFHENPALQIIVPGKVAVVNASFNGWYRVYKDGTAQREITREPFYRELQKYPLMRGSMCFPPDCKMDINRVEIIPKTLDSRNGIVMPKKIHISKNDKGYTLKETH